MVAHRVLKMFFTRALLEAFGKKAVICIKTRLVFTIGFIFSVLLVIIGFYGVLILYGLYFLVAMIGAFRTSNSINVSFLVLPAIAIQFFGYGLGFLKATLKLGLSSKNETSLFPNLFFRAQ